MKAARAINLGLSSIGVAIFAALLLYVTLAPQDFDRRTRDFAIAQVEGKVQKKLESAARSETADRLTSLAGRYSKRLEERINELRGALDRGLDVFIADVLAAACELDCERRDKAREAVHKVFNDAIARYGFALDRLQGIIVGEYREVMGELRADLTIFSASNLLAFVFALILAIVRERAAPHLLPVSIALTGATLLATAWYALGQDWVLTILTSSYWGWGYATLLAAVALVMIDIAVNRARVTTELLNGLSRLDLSPC